MSWTRVAAMARKETIQIRRDARSLIIVLVMPVLLVLLFGYGVSLDLKHLPVCVYDQDASRQSRDLIERFQASEYFHIVQFVDNYTDLTRAIDGGSARMGLVIPWDFSQKLRQGDAVGVQALVDGSDDNTANVLMNYTQAVVAGYSESVQLAWEQSRGQLPAPPPVAVQTRIWFNEDLESRAFILPGVLALVMSVIAGFVTSLTIAREWERGTMEQLISTPVTPLEILFGKLIPYFLIGMFATGVCAAIAIVWFRVPFRGSVTALFLSSALFLVVVLCTGFLASVVAKNQLAASQIALLATFLPAFILSGFLFAIEQMPGWIQVVTRFVPARYYTTLLKDIFLKGTPLAQLSAQFVPLGILTILFAGMATRAFHKRLT